MGKKLNRSSSCLNCGQALQENYDYCPVCGQQNNDSHLSFATMIKEFFSNYFSLDSRFGRSFKPFFIKPGELTVQFMNGKRVHFANPIRLYLVISLIHFFVFSLVTNNESTNEKLMSMNETQEGENNLVHLGFDESDFKTDSLDNDVDNSWHPSMYQLSKIYFLTENKNLTYQNICDSLSVSEMTGTKKYLTRQAIKLQMSDADSINDYLIKNIPILMFILLPIYALILKLFFRKKLYIHHLIHSIHLHSFMFMILTFIWLAQIILPLVPEFFNIIAFIIFCIYLIFSFVRNYALTKLKATFTVLLSGILYSCILLFGVIAEILISLMIF